MIIIDDFDDVNLTKALDMYFQRRALKKKWKKTPFNISMDPDLKDDFKAACKFNHADHNELVTQWAREYIKENAPGIVAQRKRAIALQEQQEADEIERLLEVKDKAAVRASESFVYDKVFQLISVPTARGEYMDRTEPVSLEEIDSILVKTTRKFTVSQLEVLEIIRKRILRLDDGPLKNSFDCALNEISKRLEIDARKDLSDQEKELLKAPELVKTEDHGKVKFATINKQDVYRNMRRGEVADE